MMCLSTFYYAWLAYRLSQKTGRADVCAAAFRRPACRTVIVTFVIMLPITIKTGDPMKGWAAGLVWVFFQSFISDDRRLHCSRDPENHAARGPARHARRRVRHPSSRCGRRWRCTWTPQIGLICFAIILVSWFGGVKYFKGIQPASWPSRSA